MNEWNKVDYYIGSERQEWKRFQVFNQNSRTTMFFLSTFKKILVNKTFWKLLVARISLFLRKFTRHNIFQTNQTKSSFFNVSLGHKSVWKLRVGTISLFEKKIRQKTVFFKQIWQKFCFSLKILASRRSANSESGWAIALFQKKLTHNRVSKGTKLTRTFWGIQRYRVLGIQELQTILLHTTKQNVNHVLQWVTEIYKKNTLHKTWNNLEGSNVK